MTLASQIVADAAIYLNADDFAQMITHYPGGNLSSGVSLTAIVELQDEEPRGDFGSRDANGHCIFRQCTVILPAATVVNFNDYPGPDGFKINGEIWKGLRIVGRNSALQFVLCQRTEKDTTKRSRA